ncbi:DUF397 domain-containing protein [Streptomyces sp. NRRL F-5135]|uniref:DUF397 domain-containing protein n=1 Tax=Streptomyces sp. NRRL F-5135 TaxID=1463858 RepID=UPI0004CB760B|nr:DUF397 domain-containing protein [Streptomyces sp. NRRL F-5135]
MSSSRDLVSARWVRSSYSGTGGNNCVEWAPAHVTASGVVPVRDSKNPDGPALVLDPHAWADFVAHAADQV